MKILRGVLLLIIITSFLLTMTGCTSSNNSQIDVYKKDIADLKAYPRIVFYYDHLEFANNTLNDNLKTLGDVTFAYMNGHQDTSSALLTVLKEGVQQNNSVDVSKNAYNIITEEIESLNLSVNLSDADSILNDMEEIIKFLNEACLVVEEYGRTLDFNDELSKMLDDAYDYRNIANDNSILARSIKYKMYEFIRDI